MESYNECETKGLWPLSSFWFSHLCVLEHFSFIHMSGVIKQKEAADGK